MNDIPTPEEQRTASNARRREYYHKNKEKCRQSQNRYKKVHRGRYTQLQRQWREKNPLQVYESCIKRVYGISYERVRQMFIEQDGVCPICSNKFGGKKDMQIDHNHATGQIRQLLCQNCNRGLGIFKENTSTLLNAIKYLKRWATPITPVMR